MPAARATLGRRVDAVPLWLAAGSAGVALQVRQRPRRRSGAVEPVAARALSARTAVTVAGRAVASQPLAPARLQPGAGAGQAAGVRAAGAAPTRCAATGAPR